MIASFEQRAPAAARFSRHADRSNPLVLDTPLSLRFLGDDASVSRSPDKMLGVDYCVPKFAE